MGGGYQNWRDVIYECPTNLLFLVIVSKFERVVEKDVSLPFVKVTINNSQIFLTQSAVRIILEIKSVSYMYHFEGDLKHVVTLQPDLKRAER